MRTRRLAEYHVGRRRRVDREIAPRVNGRWAEFPEYRLPVQRFTITPESCWSQPGCHSSDEARSAHICRREESDAA